MTEQRIVVDASAFGALLGGDGAEAAPELRRRLLSASLIAPEIIDLELIGLLRARAAGRTDIEPDATQIVRQLPHAPISRVSHRSLTGRVWELREVVPPADAAYLALAEELDIPLVTCDPRLAGAAGHHARIELFPAR